MDEITEKAISYINELFSGDHGGHDAAHTLRVYNNALMIAKTEPDCDMSVVSLGALLHDADDHKLFDTADNANARGFLSQNGVPEETVDRICAVINAVSFSKNRGRQPETPEGRIVQDADRLDAIGATGIARTFAYGGEHGRSLEASVRHFYDKLLLLKDEMNTETGKRLADERHRYLEEFLEHWHDETGCRGE